jgi:hypothetical protein
VAKMKGTGSKGTSHARKQGFEKHTSFFRLVDACVKLECPICHVVHRRVQQYFDGLLYEKVNDPEIRRRFRAAGGFCNPHSVQFVGYHDGLAGSILYRDLLSTWLKKRSKLPTHSLDGILPGCPVCREKSKIEDIYLALLAEFLEDDQMKQGLLSSDGLCLPHLAMLAERLQKSRKAVPDWLMDFQRGMAERIVADLDTYVDSCNFSLGKDRPRLSREQELTWQRAVCKTAGFLFLVP